MNENAHGENDDFRRKRIPAKGGENEDENEKRKMKGIENEHERNDRGSGE